MDAKKVGKVIAKFRKEAGFTQKTLSEALSVTDKAVSKWERGLGCPDISLLPKLSILLDTDIESILSGESIHGIVRKKGILILDDKTDTNAGTIVYDKPLVYYLLSSFLLIGIKDILVIANQRDVAFMQNNLAGGERIGLEITYSDRYDGRNLGRTLESANAFSYEGNILLVYGKMLLYGMNVTRQFQSILSQNAGGVRMSLCNGACIPICFFGNTFWRKMALRLEEIKDTHDLYEILNRSDDMITRRFGRGMIGLPLDTYDEAADASQLVRLIQRTQGQSIACIEEIAWRRGLIGDERLRGAVQNMSEKEYRTYLLSLIGNDSDRG